MIKKSTKMDGFGIPAISPDQLFSHSSFLFYGSPGSGKTRLAASAQDVDALCPVLILDTEGSTSVLANLVDPQKTEIRRITEWNAKTAKFLEYIVNEPQDHGFKTVIIDTLPGLQQLMVRRASDVNGSKGGKLNNSLEVGTPTESDWGAIGSSMIRILDGFNKAPFLSVTTAHAMTDGAVIRPAVQGKMAPNDMPGRPFAVGFMEVLPPGTVIGSKSPLERPLELVHFGFTMHNGKTTWAKARTEKLPHAMPSPTFTKIYDAVTSADTK